MNRIVFLAFALVFLLYSFEGAHAHSPMYFDMVNDVVAGRNYYDVLQVPRTATEKEIRRSFRKLALDYHPDKITESKSFTKAQIEERYHLLIRANEILLSDVARAEYDELLEKGVPWGDKYYGRYAHKYGAPVHDVRYVIAILIGIITVLQYAYKWYRHYYYLDLIKTRMIQSGKKVPENFVVYGAQKPTWQEIFIVQLVFFPYELYKFILRVMFWAIGKQPWMTKEEWEQHQMNKYGMTKQEFDKEKKQAEDRMQNFKQSAKYKQMKRWMKNR
eukprot:TRINITY_DN1113_c0_g1_i1.p1 TRINITY_DN1113_c0_g1~~TRINITY_DN1113_c0_g1_i1.p1  ORF type:complete len:274 (-),score=42.59 TRINITY_DN1113_c0_g1_i1:53-874(-)